MREASDRDIALANSLNCLNRKRSTSSASNHKCQFLAYSMLLTIFGLVIYESSLRQRSPRLYKVCFSIRTGSTQSFRRRLSLRPTNQSSPRYSPQQSLDDKTRLVNCLLSESDQPPETGAQYTTQLPGVSPDTLGPSAPPFAPDLLDGVLSSAVPSTGLQTPGLRYPEPFSGFAPTSSSPGVSRASSATRSSIRPSRRGSTGQSKLLSRPVSAKPSAASVRDSIARR